MTDREWQVFDLIVNEGLDNGEIAARLGITKRSAKFHVANILRKMGAPDRLKLTVTYWKSSMKKGGKPGRPPVPLMTRPAPSKAKAKPAKKAKAKPAKKAKAKPAKKAKKK